MVPELKQVACMSKEEDDGARLWVHREEENVQCQVEYVSRVKARSRKQFGAICGCFAQMETNFDTQVIGLVRFWTP